MKRMTCIVPGLLILVSQLASAGPLYGTVQISQTPAVAVTILVACPGFNGSVQPQLFTTQTDRYGSYSLLVPTSGRCEMRVEGNGQKGNAFEVYVSNNPLRLDFGIDSAMNRVN
jgi:hypothetical protein